jgi:CheY-like chemotaxis protein
MAKILLVEDDNNLREIYEARLQAEGYDIVSARDGEEALTVAMKERPDLIISDVMMPKISGFDMLDIIRSTEETKNAKVIMMTALSQAEDKERATKLGADRYLVKSQVTLEDVTKIAREVLSDDIIQSSTEVPRATPSAIAQSPLVEHATPISTVALAAPTPTENSTTTPSATIEAPADPVTNDTSTVATAIAPPAPAVPVENSSISPALSVIAPATDNTTVEDEQSAIAAQIESFIETKKIETTEETLEPKEQVTPTTESTTVQSTVNEEFSSSLPEPKTEPETDSSSEPEKATETPPVAYIATDSSTTTGKKVIQPISDPTASINPDLEQLLKKEEEKEQMAEIAKAVTAEKSSVDDELSAGAALDSTTRVPQYTATEDMAVDSPQLTIIENGDLEVKSPPSDTPLEPETPSELIDSSSVPKVDYTTPIIPHSNGTSLDGVVQPSQSNPATNTETPPVGGVDPNSIAL